MGPKIGCNCLSCSCLKHVVSSEQTKIQTLLSQFFFFFFGGVFGYLFSASNGVMTSVWDMGGISGTFSSESNYMALFHRCLFHRCLELKTLLLWLIR